MLFHQVQLNIFILAAMNHSTSMILHGRYCIYITLLLVRYAILPGVLHRGYFIQWRTRNTGIFVAVRRQAEGFPLEKVSIAYIYRYC